VLDIDEYCVDKRTLVDALFDGHEHSVLVGEITDYEFADRGELAVDTVTVTHDSSETHRFAPDFVVSAAGTGTHGLFESLVETTGFRAAGGEPERVRDALSPVTYRNVHMLTVPGAGDRAPGHQRVRPPRKR